MKVELKKLELTNYRNISHAYYEFDGNSKIVGENRIGKTNTLEAIVWLLTDKLLNGSSDIASIKPLDDTKAEVRVWASFLVDGKEITMRKEYGEDWVKTRGTTDLIFKGHYLTYYYNEVKQKTQRDFYALFKEDFGIRGDFKGIDLTRLLIDPFYLGNMGETDSWKDVRAFIISLIGDVSDIDVLNSNPKFVPLKYDLETRSGRIDEVKKYYQGTIKTLEEQIVGDDALVKMLEETPCPTDEEVAIANKGIEEINEDISKLQTEKASEKAIVDLDKQITSKKERMLELQSEMLKKNQPTELNNELTKANEKYRELLIQKSKLMSELDTHKHDAEGLKIKLDSCNEKRTSIISQLRDIDVKLAEPFAAECPTCHRPLEGFALEEAKMNHFADLNNKRDSLLEEGKANKAVKEMVLKAIQDEENAQVECESSIESIKADIDACLKEIETIGNCIKFRKEQEVEKPEELTQIEVEIAQLQEEREKVVSGNVAHDSFIREKIEEKMKAKVPFNKVVDDYAYALRQKENLASTLAARKEHANQLAMTEQKKELLNAFIKAKLDLLDEKVNKVFGNIKFQLIKENINGGYDTICKPYIYDVDKEKSTSVSWRNGSKSERVITGIAIAEKIKAALGLPDLPYLFDEGGEISTDTFNTKFKTNSQLICVKVTDNIKTPMVMKI